MNERHPTERELLERSKTIRRKRRLEMIKQTWEAFKQDKLGMFGLTVIIIFLIMGLMAPVVRSINPDVYDPLLGMDPEIIGAHPPTKGHILGTDFMGRDVFVQFLYGARLAFMIGITAAFIAVVIGTTVGLISGYFGGWTDTILMRITDILLTLPTLPLILIVQAAVGKQSIWVTVFIIAVLGWMSTARVIRAQTLSLKTRPFVEAARVAGASHFRIIFSHIAPNVLPLSFLYMTFGVTSAILYEAALSFIGLGDPTAVSWGMMLQWCQTSGHIFNAPWWFLPPGIGISMLTLSFYLIGRALETIINPKLRER